MTPQDQGAQTSFPDEEVFYSFHDQFAFRPEADVRWPPFIEESDVPEKVHVIRHGLERRGFPSEEIRKIMGGNVLRVYDQVLVRGRRPDPRPHHRGPS